MAATRLKAIARKNVATQTELPCKCAAVQVSGCKECLSLSLMTEGSGDTSCVRCDRVDDLLGLVAELKEEVERLRSIRECEREIDWWTRTLPSLRQRQQREAPQEAEVPLPPCHGAGGDLRDEGEWIQVPARGGRRVPSRSPSPSQLPLRNRYGALELEDQVNEDQGVGEALSREVPRLSRAAPRILTASEKRKRRVIVVGHSLLKGTEGPICRPDPSHREVCCLPGARVKDITGELLGLVRISDYYPLLVVQVGSDEIAGRNPKAIKRDFRALGRLVEGAQVVFSSVP